MVYVKHAMSQGAAQAEIDLITLLAAYDESVVDNALFQQTASAAVQAALSGSTAEEVFKCMLEIPNAHPGMPEACRLSLNAYRQERSDELRRQPVATLMAAVRKAATTTVGWVIGLNPDVVLLHPNDEIWLKLPELEQADGLTTCYWTCCSTLVGIVLAQEVAADNGGEATDFDPDIYDGAHRAFSKLKDLLGSDVDMDNLRAYAQQLADWIQDEEGFRELSEALIEKRYLNDQDIENLLTQNGLGAASLRFHHRSWPHVEIGFETAMTLRANDPSLMIYVLKTQLDSEDASLLLSGVPISC